MKHVIVLIVTMLSTVALSHIAKADEHDKQRSGEIKVTWQNFSDYRDVRSAMEPPKSFHERVKRSFEKFFDEYSSQLPEGQTLSVTITDLDLAGDVIFNSSRETRVMKDLFFPRMEFNYSLKDSDGSVIKEGTAQLKDKNYLYHEKSWKRYKEGFYYEKRMFRKWFEGNISNS